MKLNFSASLPTGLIDINLELVINHPLAISGSNGVGKTSLLNYIYENAFSIVPQKLINYLQQKPLKPLAHLTAYDYFGLLAQWHQIDFNLFLENPLYERWNIDSLLKRPIHKLSGGENQMIKILGVFFLDADLYIIDEATNNLDADKRIDLIHYIQRKSQKSLFLVVDHDIEFIKKIKARQYSLIKKENKLQIRDIDA